MVTEIEAETFSSEDGSNVLISCALSSIAYELLPNFEAILKSNTARQHKIKLFDLLARIAHTSPSFLATGNRFKDSVEPSISKAIADFEPGDMLMVMLLKAQAGLLNGMIAGLNNRVGR